MIHRERWSWLLKRAAFVIPAVVVLAGCNVWSMYGGGPTHLSYDSSGVITTSNASTLVEAGTTAAATGSNSWIDSSPTLASNNMLYATANYAASGDCENIEDPNDFRLPTDSNDPELRTTTKQWAVKNECADTIGELYAYSATAGTTNCPTQPLAIRP